MIKNDLTQIMVGIEQEPVRQTIVRCLNGDISPAIAVTLLLIHTEGVEATGSVLSTAGRRVSALMPATPDVCQKIAEMQQLLYENQNGCANIVTMLRDSSTSNGQARSVDDQLAFFSQLFDKAVSESEEVSVAWYSLGNPQLLHEATKEVVDLLDKWEVLGPDGVMLDIGCGIGRIEVALAGQVREAHGIDVSANMVEAAKRRCAGLSNVYLSTSSGRDLAPFASNKFDLVLAVDSFPYINQSGPALVEKHFEEVARVLRKGGNFVILNFSYRDDLEADQADMSRLAGTYGFELLVNGTKPFTLWDGQAWLLRSIVD